MLCAGNKNQFRALVEEIETLGGHVFFSGAQNKDYRNVFTDGGFKDRCFVRIVLLPRNSGGKKTQLYSLVFFAIGGLLKMI